MRMTRRFDACCVPYLHVRVATSYTFGDALQIFLQSFMARCRRQDAWASNRRFDALLALPAHDEQIYLPLHLYHVLACLYPLGYKSSYKSSDQIFLQIFDLYLYL